MMLTESLLKYLYDKILKHQPETTEILNFYKNLLKNKYADHIYNLYQDLKNSPEAKQKNTGF